MTDQFDLAVVGEGIHGVGVGCRNTGRYQIFIFPVLDDTLEDTIVSGS
jgi:hypothetical protein